MAENTSGQAQGRQNQNGLSAIANKASDAVSSAADTLKNTNLDDATRMAQQGGRYAYETASSHPYITAAIAGLGAYLLFGPSWRSSRDDYYDQARDSAWSYADRASKIARDYADRARDQYSGYDPRDALDYGRDAAYRLSSQARTEPLAAAVGLGLLAWMVASAFRSR